MKCPHCGIEVEPGTLFCPECLTEIPWVPEYNTVETLMTKEKTKKEEAEHKEEHPKQQVQKKQRRKRKWGLLLIGALLFLAVVLKIAWEVWAYYSFDHQYDRALAAYEEGDYESSLGYIDRALELDDADLDVNILYARALAAQGDVESAVNMLKMFLDTQPDQPELYRALVSIYENEEMYEEIHQLFSQCENEDILEEFQEYVVTDPTASVDTGVYDEEQLVELQSDAGTIYYTLDGSDPTADSIEYTEPIEIPEGVTELKAVCINEKHIPSDIIYRKYTVVIKGPDAPEVTPEEGTYTSPVTITMEVPEGCKGYYTFDSSQVSTASQEYTGPVEMPEGTHVFYGILVAANGKESDIVSRTYTYTPQAEPADGVSEPEQ